MMEGGNVSREKESELNHGGGGDGGGGPGGGGLQSTHINLSANGSN